MCTRLEIRKQRAILFIGVAFLLTFKILQLWLTKEEGAKGANVMGVELLAGNAEANVSAGMHQAEAVLDFDVMPCFHPIVLDELIVPCSRCVGCIQARRDAWTFRLMEQDKVSLTSQFLTFTYDEDSVPFNAHGHILVRKHFQDFMKRLRHIEPHKLKYYTVGEYGDKFERPHYHSILFDSVREIEEITEKWEKGNVFKGNVSLSSIHYVTGYITHKLQKHRKGTPKPFSLMSKGLGSAYIEKRNREAEKWHKRAMDTTVILPGGHKNVLPRYYREKIFTPDERSLIAEKKEILARERLSQQSWEDFRNQEEAKWLKLIKRKQK